MKRRWSESLMASGTIHLRLGENAKKTFLKWWGFMQSENADFVCYAVFLILPSDEEIIDYLQKNYKEINLLSRNDCLVMTFYDKNFDITTLGVTDYFYPSLSEMDTGEFDWTESIKAYPGEGYSVALADIFNIKFTDFPCMILFKDMRIPEYTIVSLKNMGDQQISQTLREVFSIISDAANKSINPVVMLNRKKRRNSLKNNGKSIITTAQGMANKTFEAIIEAVISGMIKP